jgi:hypothetical protein
MAAEPAGCCLLRVTTSRGYEYGSAPEGTGWVAFAAILLGLGGTWNVLEGILAIGKSRVYGGVQDSAFVFSDLRTWGWIVALLGALQLVAAFTVVNGSSFGRWFGIASAFVNSIGQLSFVPAYPFWALTMVAIDIVIIYALAMYAGAPLRRPSR